MDDALVFHRLQFAFTIIYHYLFPQLTMGLALLIVILKARGLGRDGERWNDAARFWIRIFGINFAVGVVTGIPMEFQFGTNWAPLQPVRGQRDRTDARDGGALRVLPGIELPVASGLGGATALAGRALPRRGGPVRRELGLRLLHHRDQCLHAAPGRVRGRRGWHAPDRGLPGLRAESVGARPVRPQHGRRGGHRRLRHGRGGRVLHADRAASADRPALPPARRRGGPRRERARRGHRRSAGQDGRRPSAGGPGRHGGPFRERSPRRARDHRPAQCRGAPAGQPRGDPVGALVPRLRDVPRRGAGPRRVSAGRLARQHRAPLLLFPHHGRPRHHPHRDRSLRGAARLARAGSRPIAPCCGSSCSRFRSRTSRTPSAG